MNILKTETFSSQPILKKMIRILLFAIIILLSSFSFSQSIPLSNLEIKGDVAYYENKKFTGHCTEYFRNGRLKYEANYKDGLKNGIEQSYYENGMKRLQVTYSEGLRHGDCGYRFYTIDGQLRSMLDYDKGVKTGYIISPEIYYYAVIVGEKDGAIKRDLVKGKDSVQIKILRTYNQYFKKDGSFNSAEFAGTVFTPDMDYVTVDEVRFLSFRMKGILPIYPPRETIYDHVKFNAKSTDGYLTLSMRQTFKNMLLKELSIEEVYLNKLINNKNYVWQLPARKLLIAD